MSRLIAQYRIQTCRPVIFIMVLFSIIFMSGNELSSSEAHFVAKNIQQWESNQGNILIQFAYEPERPLIDTFTELKFNIQNLSTGQHVENLTGRVVVTNGQRLFKFENISIPTGHFSVKYIFPDDGTHQVLLRLDRGNDFKIPASFDVFVPHQSPPSILDPFPSSSGTSNDDMGVWISKILAILLPASAITAIIVILKKPKKHS
ncbi:MAG TPA: hypothetical protein VLD84_11335 [Nitrososphaeraceae archaeon]|nr:hypothetical protein [Nitrososphaeraceae archaeon]